MAKNFPIYFKLGVQGRFKNFPFLKFYFGIQQKIEIKTVPNLLGNVANNISKECWKASQEATLNATYQGIYQEGYQNQLQQHYSEISSSIANHALKQGLQDGLEISKLAVNAFASGAEESARELLQNQGGILTLEQSVIRRHARLVSRQICKNISEVRSEVSELDNLLGGCPAWHIHQFSVPSPKDDWTKLSQACLEQIQDSKTKLMSDLETKDTLLEKQNQQAFQKFIEQKLPSIVPEGKQQSFTVVDCSSAPSVGVTTKIPLFWGSALEFSVNKKLNTLNFSRGWQTQAMVTLSIEKMNFKSSIAEITPQLGCGTDGPCAQVVVTPVKKQELSQKTDVNVEATQNNASNSDICQQNYSALQMENQVSSQEHFDSNLVARCHTSTVEASYLSIPEKTMFQVQPGLTLPGYESQPIRSSPMFFSLFAFLFVLASLFFSRVVLPLFRNNNGKGEKPN